MIDATPTQVMPCVGVGFRQPHYRRVLETLPENKPELDFLEVHAENFFNLDCNLGGASKAVLEQARSHYPISLHGVGLSLGSAQGLDAAHLAAFADLVQRCDPFLISDHLCFGRASTEAGVVHANDLLPTQLTKASLQAFCNNIDHAQTVLKRPLSIENISSYIQWRDADYSEIDFINLLAQRTGCGVLLDLNNIYVNALNAGESDPTQACKTWVNALHNTPTEIHLAGFSPSNSLVIDDHSSPVSAPVWALYEHALNRFGAVPTLIEWDTQLPEFEVLYQEAQTARKLQQTLYD